MNIDMIIIKNDAGETIEVETDFKDGVFKIIIREDSNL